VLSYLLFVLSGGILWLLARWYPTLALKFSHRSCSLRLATKMLVRDQYGESIIADVVRREEACFPVASEVYDDEAGVRFLFYALSPFALEILTFFFFFFEAVAGGCLPS
jgi:hypothetical protein